MFKEIKKTSAEVEPVYDAAATNETAGISKFPGMTYEQGVIAAFDWLYGRREESPLED